MASFYEDWLRRSTTLEEAMRRTPVVARGDALGWIETVQDWRAAMVVGEEVGFQTSGTTLVKAEIPPASRTGRSGHDASHHLRRS